MSSFRRKLNRPFIVGTTTSPQTGQIITGSGNPALDELLGGGIPMNSIVLIEEDKHCIYSKVLCKYFVAEGIIQNQRIFLASLDDNPEEIIKKLPEPVFENNFCNKQVPSEYEQLIQDTTSLRIAWRYNDLPYLNVNKNLLQLDEGHHFNLLNYMPENKVAAANKVLWNGNFEKQIDSEENSFNQEIADEEKDKESETANATDADIDFDVDLDADVDTNTEMEGFFRNKLFQNLVDALMDTLKEDQRLTDFWRICIPSLGSPLWYDENFGDDLLKFLTILRAFVQNSQCVCFLTMPMHLIAKHNKILVPKIRNLVDYAIELESFSGSEQETNPAFKDYNGLIHFRKMSAINSLALFQHSDLAFKLRRKKFVIEKFHLPPELGQDTTETVQCAKWNVQNKKRMHLSQESLYY